MDKSLLEIVLTQITDYSAVKHIVNTLQSIFYATFFLIFLAVFVHQVGKNLFSGKGLVMNWPEFIRILILAALFSSYNSSVGTIGRYIDKINIKANRELKENRSEYNRTAFISVVNTSSIKFTQEERDYLISKASTDRKKNKELLKEAVEKVKVRENNEIADAVIAGSKAIVETKNIGRKIWHSIVFAVGQGLEFIMAIFLLGLDKILYGLGILSIVFSLIPAWKDKFTTWLGTWVVVKFSFLSMAVLNEIHKLMIIGSYNTGEFQFGSDFMEYGTALVSLVLYILIIWLTSRYIGSGEAGKVFSTAMAAITSFAGLAVASRLGGAAGQMGGGSPGGGNVAGDIAGSAANMAGNTMFKKPGET